MSDIALFSLALLCGGLLSPVYLLLSLLRKSGGIAGTVLVDIFTGALLFAPLVILAIVYTDGAITFHSVIGLTAGFFACRAALKALFKHIKARRRKKGRNKGSQKG